MSDSALIAKRRLIDGKLKKQAEDLYDILPENDYPVMHETVKTIMHNTYIKGNYALAVSTAIDWIENY